MWNKHARSVCAGEQPLQRKVDANHSEISKAKVSLSIKEGDQRRDKERRAARREETSEMWRIAGNPTSGDRLGYGVAETRESNGKHHERQAEVRKQKTPDR